MPSKLIVKLGFSGSSSPENTVAVQEEGKDPVTLRYCTRVVIDSGDSNDRKATPTATVTMYTPGLDTTVDITADQAKAIMQYEAQRSLAFLDDADVGGLLELHATLEVVRGWPKDDIRLVPLAKILAVLAKREPSPF